MLLDEWFEKRVKEETKGYAGIVRYADDSVACFQYKADNTKSIRQFYNIVAKTLYRTLNRRSEKNKYSYRKYYEKIQKQIVRPRIYVDIVKMSMML